MSLTCHWICAYYSQRAHEEIAARNQSLWDAYMFCKAVKTGEINGYCTVPRKSGNLRIDANNVGRARRLFGRFVGKKIREAGLEEATIVPVPSKDSFFSRQEFRSLTMLRDALPDNLQENIEALSVFKTELAPASQGGPRGYGAIYPHLATRRNIAGRRIVLVDDIVTTGGTILAVRDKLKANGATVEFAVVCGRTVATMEAAFEERSFQLADDVGEIAF